MLKDALEFIFGQANNAANPTPSTRMLGPRTRIVSLEGEESTETLEPPLVKRTAETLGCVGELSEKYGKAPAAYVNESGITVVLDNEDRLEAVRMQFQFSDPYKALLSLEDGMAQRALVKVLRTTLAGCVDHEGFLAIVRQLEFDVNRGARADLKHTKESMGRSVEKEVRANAGEMPEEIRIVVPLFTVPHDVPTEITLMCAVTLDIDNERIGIAPTGDSLAREQKRVMTEIVSRLDALMPDESLVVFGTCEVNNLIG